MSQSPPATPRKPPNIWAVASVTYGAVIAVTIISILAYYYLAPNRTPSQLGDATRSTAIGSVWLPIYPGATVQDTGYTKQDNITDSRLKFDTADQADRVLAFYQAAMKKGVFRFQTFTKDGAGGTVRSIVHQGKTNVSVTIHTAGDRTQGEIRTIDKDLGDKAGPN